MPEDLKLGIDEVQPEGGAGLSGILERAGVKTMDELLSRIEQGERLQEDYNSIAAQLRQLKKEEKVRRTQKVADDYGLMEGSDPALKSMASKIDRLESTLTALNRHLSAENGDKNLQPYLRRAEVEHPDLMAIDDDAVRDRALHTVAQAMRVNEVAKGDVERARREGHEHAALAARVQFTGGGPGAGRKPEYTDDQILDLYGKDIHGKPVKTIDRITEEYKKRYPHLFP